MKFIYLCCFIISALLSFNVSAGFLVMPEINEMPEIERKSMIRDLDIPSVRDRDSDPEAGPRLNVAKFKLEGLVEFPELGITKADIVKLIDSIRFDLMDEYKILDSGFTETELEDVSQLLVEIEEETMERHVSELEVQKLIWLIREQRSNRGITLGQIETVADRITTFYREKGFILAKAYIPKQEVRDGIVTLTVLLGTLGEVEVVNNELYDSNKLSYIFDDMLTRPVTSSEVQEKLYLINDYPGVTATGFFQPGSQVGDTKLNINIRNEKAYDANIRLDNHGSEQTGLYRLYAEAFWHNPVGNGDQFQFASLYTLNPNNSTFFQLRYSTRLFSPRFNLSIGASNNDFILGPGNNEVINKLGIYGETKQADITASYSFKRNRTASYYGDIVYDNIESQLRLGEIGGGDDERLDDIVSNLSLVLRFDVLDEENKILHQGDVKLVSGQFDQGVEGGQDKNYSILNMNYSLLTFWRLPYFDSNSRIIYRASLQFASSPLSSINQFALAGPSKARAYPVNQFSADHAFYTGVDWIFDSPQIFDVSVGDSNLRNMLQPFVFLDASWGKALSLDSTLEDSTGQLIDTGLGLQFSYGSHINGHFQLAFPVNEKFSALDVNVSDDSYRIVFDFQYSFR